MQIYSEYLGDVAKYKGISQSAAWCFCSMVVPEIELSLVAQRQQDLTLQSSHLISTSIIKLFQQKNMQPIQWKLNPTTYLGHKNCPKENLLLVPACQY